jgi:replication initiation and membrane attachment protein
MLKANDGLSVRIVRTLSAEEMQSLMICYVPLIGHDGVILYLSVVSGAYGEDFLTHQPLLEQSDMTIDQLENARVQCERAHLIRTFKKSVSEREFYVWQVELPLIIHDFMGHEVLGRRLYNNIGKSRFDAIKMKFTKVKTDFSDFKAVSASFRAMDLVGWDAEFESDFQLVKPSSVPSAHLEIKFDTQKFLRDISPLAFPISSRNNENIRLIEECATIYGISEEDMRMLVSRCIRLKDQSFDTDKFKQKVRGFKGLVPQLPQDPYTAPSIAFLQSKQNGIAVSSADKKLIEHLILEMKLTPEVVNVLLEYVLENNQMRLNRSYVEKIAASWIRLNISNKEDALAQTHRETPKGKSSRKDVLPLWFEEESEEKTSASQPPVDRASLIKKIKGGN